MTPLGNSADILSHVMRLFRLSGANLAERSAKMGTPFGLNQNFVSNLRNTHAIPSLHHLYALSELLRLRMGSVFQIFGLDIDCLASLENQLNQDRTRLIETCPFGANSTVNVPATLSPLIASETTAFLYELVPAWRQVPLTSLKSESWSDRRYIYGKMGMRDSNASPDIPPGAYIQMRAFPQNDVDHIDSISYYFVQHPWGYTVCRCFYEDGWLYLRSQNPSYSGPHRLRYGRQVLIFGRVTAFAAALPTEGYQKVPIIPDLRLVLAARPPWDSPSVQSLFALERNRLVLTRDQIDAAGARLEEVLATRITGKYARELEQSEHFPRTATALGLAAIYSIRLTDLFRSCGITLNNPRKYDVTQLLSLQSIQDLPDWPITTPPPEPSKAWIELTQTWHEWPVLLSRVQPNPEQAAHSIVRLHQSDYYSGLDPLIRPGSLVFIDESKRSSVVPTTQQNGLDTDWARPLYVVRHNVDSTSLLYCGYLEASPKRILLRAHPRAHSTPVKIWSRNEVAILGEVVGIASHF